NRFCLRLSSLGCNVSSCRVDDPWPQGHFGERQRKDSGKKCQCALRLDKLKPASNKKTDRISSGRSKMKAMERSEKTRFLFHRRSDESKDNTNEARVDFNGVDAFHQRRFGTRGEETAEASNWNTDSEHELVSANGGVAPRVLPTGGLRSRIDCGLV